MPLGPNVRQSIVDLAFRANRNKRDLAVDKLHVFEVGRVVRVSESNQPARFDNEEIVRTVNVLLERFSRSELEVPNADSLVLQHHCGPNALGRFGRHHLAPAFIFAARAATRTSVTGSTTRMHHCPNGLYTP